MNQISSSSTASDLLGNHVASGLGKRKCFLCLLLMILYGLFVGVMSLRHDMWRDEAQLWLLALKSDSLQELFQNTKDELRPMGWFFICWLVSRFTDEFETIKLLNFLFSIACAYLILFKLRIPKVTGALFLFSFLPLLGYSTISEDYMLGLFLLVCFLTVRTRENSEHYQFLLLGALANIHFLYFLIAAPGVLYVTSHWFNQSGRRIKDVLKSSKILVSAGISIALCLFSLAVIWPAPSNRWRPKPVIDLVGNLTQASNSLVYAIFPFVDSSNLRTFNPNLWLFIVLGTWSTVLCLLFLVYLVNRTIFILGLVVIGLLVGNMTFGYGYYWWHFGVLFIALFTVAALGISEFSTKATVSWRLNCVLVLLLVPQVFSVVTMPGQLLLTSREYSSAKLAAETVKTNCEEPCIVVAAQEMYGVAISAYLDGKELYYVDKQRFGTFADWGDSENYPVSWDAMVQALAKFENAVLVAPISDQQPPNVKTIAQFPNAIWGDESFGVYQLLQN